MTNRSDSSKNALILGMFQIHLEGYAFQNREGQLLERRIEYGERVVYGLWEIFTLSSMYFYNVFACYVALYCFCNIYT